MPEALMLAARNLLRITNASFCRTASTASLGVARGAEEQISGAAERRQIAAVPGGAFGA